MNIVILNGRIVNDPELKENSNGKKYAKGTIAVDRTFSKEKRESDFISCIFWDKTAEVLCKYVKKGNKIAIEGSIRTGSYEKTDGTKAYTTDVVVKKLELLENKTTVQEPKEIDKVEEDKDDDFDVFKNFGKENNTGLEIDDEDLPF